MDFEQCCQVVNSYQIRSLQCACLEETRVTEGGSRGVAGDEFAKNSVKKCDSSDSTIERTRGGWATKMAAHPPAASAGDAGDRVRNAGVTGGATLVLVGVAGVDLALGLVVTSGVTSFGDRTLVLAGLGVRGHAVVGGVRRHLVVNSVTASLARLLLTLRLLPVRLLVVEVARGPAVVLRGLRPGLRLQAVRAPGIGALGRGLGAGRGLRPRLDLAVRPGTGFAGLALLRGSALGARADLDARVATLSVGLEAAIEPVANLDVTVREHGVGTIGLRAADLDRHAVGAIGNHVQRPDALTDRGLTVRGFSLERLELINHLSVKVSVVDEASSEVVDPLGRVLELDRGQVVVGPLAVVRGGQIRVERAVLPAGAALVELRLDLCLAPRGDCGPEGTGNLLVGSECVGSDRTALIHRRGGLGRCGRRCRHLGEAGQHGCQKQGQCCCGGDQERNPQSPIGLSAVHDTPRWLAGARFGTLDHGDPGGCRLGLAILGGGLVLVVGDRHDGGLIDRRHAVVEEFLFLDLVLVPLAAVCQHEVDDRHGDAADSHTEHPRTIGARRLVDDRQGRAVRHRGGQHGVEQVPPQQTGDDADDDTDTDRPGGQVPDLLECPEPLVGGLLPLLEHRETSRVLGDGTGQLPELGVQGADLVECRLELGLGVLSDALELGFVGLRRDRHASDLALDFGQTLLALLQHGFDPGDPRVGARGAPCGTFEVGHLRLEGGQLRSVLGELLLELRELLLGRRLRRGVSGDTGRGGSGRDGATSSVVHDVSPIPWAGRRPHQYLLVRAMPVPPTLGTAPRYTLGQPTARRRGRWKCRGRVVGGACVCRGAVPKGEPINLL